MGSIPIFAIEYQRRLPSSACSLSIAAKPLQGISPEKKTVKRTHPRSGRVLREGRDVPGGDVAGQLCPPLLELLLAEPLLLPNEQRGLHSRRRSRAHARRRPPPESAIFATATITACLGAKRGMGVKVKWRSESRKIAGVFFWNYLLW